MQYMDVLLSYTQSTDPIQIFQLLDILGQGAYGSVSKALHKQTGELYAIKILPATSVNQISVIKKQIAILRQCNDEHIVKYFGSYFKDNNLWIVMEYCMAGSITDIVNITDKELNENEIASILELVLKGLDYLHQRKKIHRDIKAANILLDQNGTAKLADFGVSTEMMYTNARHNTHIGSPYWMSPEVIKYSEYNQKTDIWSLGVTAIELAEGIVPYSHLKPFMAMWTMKDKPIQGFKQPEKWSPQFNDFVKQCLQINPDQRPEAETLLHHDFIRKNSRGKRLLAEVVRNSMGEIENFRAGQAHKQDFDKAELKQIIFSKGDSNGSEYETKTVIVKGSQKKNSESADSVIEHSSHSRSFYKKNESDASSNNRLVDDYEDEDCGSVIIRDENNKNGHSRNCSQISVSSVLVKNDDHPSSTQTKSKEQTNFFQSYIQNMQAMHSKQEEFKQTIQEKINEIEESFMRNMMQEYSKVRAQLKLFFVEDASQQNKDKPSQPTFSSRLFSSQSLLQYMYKDEKFLTQRQKLQQEYKQKYLSSIQPVQNNYMSMMLESGGDDGSGDFNNNNNAMMQFIDDDDDSGKNVFFGQDKKQRFTTDDIKEYRKKSQSSADSPTSLFHNKKKNIKKLIIQQTLEQPNDDFLQNRDNSSVNTQGNYHPHNSNSVNHTVNRSQQRATKQSSLNRFLDKTPVLNHTNNTKYREIFVNSASFNATTANKSLLNSTGNYPHSMTTNVRGQKRVITTEPHEAYDYENDSLSTLTKLNQRNFKQFYDDPVVMNNLKQLTQQSEDYSPSSMQLNPFELKKSSFSKEIKSVKSKEKDKLGGMREKQRATHIAHVAMAHNNKDRTITNSSKKLKVIKVIEEREKSPEDNNNESIKTSKAKKSKSKNKQTASTTIPFGSVGNMGALEFLPGKIMAKSKEKKASQIPVKSGPFSKIKNKS